MEFGLTLFTSDRGIRPTTAAVAAENAGFSAFYVPEHTHIPVRREAAHPGTGGAELPDERYSRTLDFILPTGGYKQSGIGKDLGREAVLANLRSKSVLIDTTL